MIKKNKISITHISIFLLMLATLLLIIVKVVTLKYKVSISQEISVINSIVRMMDKILLDPLACAKTFKNISKKYYPLKLSAIRSRNNFAEFTINTKYTNYFKLTKLTTQYIGKANNSNLFLLKIIFTHLMTKKDRLYMKIFSLKTDRKKIQSCKQIQEIRPESYE